MPEIKDMTDEEFEKAKQLLGPDVKIVDPGEIEKRREREPKFGGKLPPVPHK